MNSLNIARSSTVARGDVFAVLIALIDETVQSLANGNQISFGKIRSLTVNLKSDGAETKDKFTQSSIKGAKVIYRPGTEIKDMLNALKLEKES